ncbi:glycosyltransferase family 39 protein [Amycolatopsis sp. NBC_00438]|uniref:glycosyltransferase family 39 protein n=1 Tax=Amycolatopsis sp. NBC_00438 TaxID=2903558 RepID=UPI002E21E442
MSTTITEAPAPAPPEAAAKPRWQPWALAVVCAAAAALYLWHIGDGRIGNSYYSAAVRSMSTGIRDFLFGSFDGLGVVTLDKPPLGQWPQVLSTALFGFHGWSLLLPQALEGVAAVFLLHRAVRRWAGENTALLAAALLALTPVTVAVDRDNNPDSLLVLLLVAAAYALTRAVRAERPRSATHWLLACAALLGFGFTTKMLQAWIVVPGFAVAYLAGPGAGLRRKAADLLGAAVVLVVTSGWWIALVDLWPGTKPYIGGSTDGSAWQLLWGYNGFSRILGGDATLPGGGLPSGMVLPPGVRLPPGGLVKVFGGEPGAGRLFGDLAGGQISWLLPLALVLLAAAAVAGCRAPRADRARTAGWLLWGSWLVVTGLLFSFAHGTWHPYYTAVLAPPMAALIAAGVAWLWRTRARWPARAVLAVGFLLTGGWAFVLIGRTPGYHGWTAAAALIGAIAAAAAVSVPRLVRPGVVLGLAAVVLTPAVWSVATATAGTDNGPLPTAGPALGGAPAPVALSPQEQRILSYARQHSGGTAITLLIDGSAMFTAPYLITTGDPVVGVGGFLGTDDVPTPATLQRWVADGTIKYVLSYTAPGDPGPTGVQRARSAWFDAHCTTLPPTEYGAKAAEVQGASSFTGLVGGERLRECHRS